MKNTNNANDTQYWIFLGLFFFLISSTQNMLGKIKAIAFEAMAPTTLNTSSMSSTAAATPAAKAKRTIVYTTKRILACFFLLALSSVSMQELISSSASFLGERQDSSFFLLIMKTKFLMREMKLFRAPKNMIGKEKNTEMRNPMFISRYKAQLVSARVKESRKLPPSSLPNKQYPILPTKMQKKEQAKTPVIEALAIFSSLASLMPLQMGKKFIWQARANIMLGITIAILKAFLAKGYISTWQLQSLVPSESSAKNVMVREATNTVIPSTPENANNFSFSIFLTKVKGISSKAATSTINAVLRQNLS